MKEVDVIRLEDGIEYAIIQKLEKDGNTYLYLTNVDDDKDFCIRKLIIQDGEEVIIGLDDDIEFDKALSYLNETFN